MFLLDLLAKYGPYAFVLMSVWFSLALVVAAWRVRRFRSRKCVLSLLGDALSCLLYPALLLFQMSYLNRSSSDWIQVLWYFTILMYMCLPVLVFAYTRRHKKMPTWRQAGYRHLIDVLLFRPPYTKELVEAVPPTEEEGRVDRLTKLLVFDIAVLLFVISFLGDSLRPCAWLDTFTKYSGCVREVKIDGLVPYALEFSPDGLTLATQGLTDTPLQLYRLEDGAQLWTVASGWGSRGSLSFSPDGKTLVNASDPDKVWIWEWPTGKLKKELLTRVDTVQFSPDGQYLATGEDKSEIQLWRINDWTLARALPAQGETMSFSPDGQLIAGVGVSKTLTIWKTEDGTVFRTLPGNGYVPYFIAYSPDGTKLANSSLLGPVQIWNIPDGGLALTLPISDTKGMAFSPDGRYLLVADWRYPESPQDVITLWRVSDGQLMLKMVENEGFISDIYSVAFAPDGKTFAYGAWEKLKIFRLPDELQ